jgi:hypothetical protein
VPAVVLALALVACTDSGKPKVTRSSLSSSSGDPTATATDVTTTTSPDKLSAELCAAFVADRERRAANAAVEFASLTLEQVRARFDAAHASLQRMIDAAEGDLRDALELQLEAQKPGQAMVEKAWGDTGEARAEVAHAAGFHDISSYVVRAGVTLSGGQVVTLSAVSRLVVRNLGRLVVGCEQPSLGVRRAETRPAPPDGAINFTGGGTDTRPPTLELVAAAGGEVTELVPTGTVGRYEAAVGRDGAVAFVAVDTAGTATLMTASSLDALDRAEEVGLPASCPQWAPDRHALVAALIDEPVDERGVYVVESGGRPTSVPLPFPAVDVGCAAFATRDELLVERVVFGGGFELWRVGLSGTPATKVYSRADCSGALGGVSPDGATAALALGCDDVREDGVHLVELATGRDEHVATVISSAPRFSPDGLWLTFASCPLGCDTTTDMRVTITRTDGTGSRPIVDEQSTWPSWLPPTVTSAGNPRT